MKNTFSTAMAIYFVTFYLLIACKPTHQQLKELPADICLASQNKCLFKTELGIFKVLFNVDKVLTEKPFNIAVIYVPHDINEKSPEKTAQYEVDNISAYLEGKEMFMGKVPLFFNALTEKNNFVAQALLGSCSQEQMMWRLWLTIKLEDKANKEWIKQSLFIDFLSNRH